MTVNHELQTEATRFVNIRLVDSQQVTSFTPMKKRSTYGPSRLPVPRNWVTDLDDYLSALSAAGRPASTTGLRRSHLSRMARGLGGSPRTVTGTQLVGWFAAQTHWRAETRRGYRSSARKFFGWALETGRVPVNAALDLDPVKPGKPAPRPLPDAAWDTAMGTANARDQLILRLGAECGLRRAEVAQVHTTDVTQGVGGWQLLVHGKGDKQRIIPIPDDLAELIQAGAPGHTPERSAFGAVGFLFPGADNGHLSPRWVGKLATRALPGIWTMHKCRHRFAAKVYRGSRNLRALQMLLGHASVATTEIYTPVDDDEIRAAMMFASAA